MKKVSKSYKDVWRAGVERSGGFGFWGHAVAHGPGADVAVRAFVGELRKKGYTDAEIAEYGDWRDGRHIGDAMYGEAPAAMRRAVARNSMSVAAFRRNPEYEGAMRR